MITRIAFAFALATLVSGNSFAADDPFCGKWKLNFEKSKITGQQMKMEELGGNKIRFNDGSVTDTIVVDGTDQPLESGATMALTKVGPNAIRMVIKRNGKLASSMVHSLSDNGQIQTIEGTSTRPDGSTSDFKVEAKRVGGGSGWSGTWESTNLKISRPDEFEINTYGDGGYTFSIPALKETLNLNLDGKDYTATGPRVAPDSSSSGKRLDQQTFEMTDKLKGKVVDQTRFQVSPDRRSLTLTEHRPGQSNAMTLAYERM
ncbi:MAG: hypothetical protein ACJ746_23850 [Bryobacteraceae bacterium]